MNTKLLTIEVVEMLPQQQTGELPFIQLTFPDTREGQAAGIEAYLRLCAAAHIRFAHPGPPEVWPAGTQ